MKKCKLFFLPLSFLLLASCGGGNVSGGETRQPLGTPVITVNTSKDGITWTAIENAVSYSVTVNGGEAVSVDTPSYAFSLEEGNYTVSVVAVADDAKFNSQAATFTYETKLASMGDLSFDSNNQVISWTSFVGLGVEYKVGDGEFTVVTGNSLEVNEGGTYTFRAYSGYNESSHVYYVDSANSTKSIEVTLVSPLDKPVLSLNQAGTGLVWQAVEGATGYSIDINGVHESTITDTQLDFLTEEGEYEVSVTALGASTQENSEAAVFSYSVVYTKLSELDVDEGVISWSESVGMGIVYTVNGGEPIALSGDSLAAAVTGQYVLSQTGGFDANNNVYYVQNESEIYSRSVTVTLDVDRVLVIEDGSEETTSDLKDKYIIEKYDTNGWTPSAGADIMLDSSNAGFTDNNCVKFKYYKHSANFRYQQSNIVFPCGFDTMSFTIKGNTDGQFKISLRIDDENASLGSVKLNGVYATYTTYFPENWTKYTIDMNTDENWVINFGGMNLSYDDVKTYLHNNFSIDLGNFSDLLPYFTTVSFLLYCTADANWSTAYAFMDDVYFSNTASGASKTELLKKRVELHDNYAFMADHIGGRLNRNGNDWSLSFTFEDNPVNLPVTVELEEDRNVRIISTVSGYDFDATLKVDDYSDRMELVSVTGSASELLNNLVADKYYVVDNFESYTETGTGYDASHGLGSISGLRAAYYADYYSGKGVKNSEGVVTNPDPNPSPVGGPGWSLMGSSDYLDLNKDTSNVHDGVQSGRFKYNKTNQMRFMTQGLLDGNVEALPYGTYLSFWTKGVSGRLSTLKIRAYSVDLVTPVNQQDGTYMTQSDAITVPVNADWTEIRVALNPNRTYYGVCILPMTYSGDVSNNNQYIYIDDICIYDSVSPYNNGSIIPAPEVKLADNYAFASDSLKGTLNNKNDNWELNFEYNDNPTTLPVSVEKLEDGNVSVKCNVTGYDFDATLSTEDAGTTLVAENVTGSAAGLLTNLKAAAYYMLDDFESYTETGNGYDASHAVETISGLRAAYYADYYSGKGTQKDDQGNITNPDPNPSPVGGPGWSLMGSSDYLNLNTDAANVHSGAQSARFKYNKTNQMRYMSFGLYDNSASELPVGQTISLWTKGVSGRSCHLKVRAYYVPSVTPGNQTSNFDVVEVTLEENADWTEVKITLDANKVYYGICILPITYSGDVANNNQYFYVDDICLYNSISPWGN